MNEEAVRTVTYQALEHFFRQKKYTKEDAFRTLRRIGIQKPEIIVTLKRNLLASSSPSNWDVLDDAMDINSHNMCNWILSIATDRQHDTKGSIYNEFDIAYLYYNEAGSIDIEESSFSKYELDERFEEDIDDIESNKYGRFELLHVKTRRDFENILKSDFCCGDDIQEKIKKELEFARGVVTHLVNFFDEKYLFDTNLRKELRAMRDVTDFKVKKTTPVAKLISQKHWDNILQDRANKVKFYLLADQIRDVESFLKRSLESRYGQANVEAVNDAADIGKRVANQSSYLETISQSQESSTKTFMPDYFKEVIPVIAQKDTYKDAIYDMTYGRFGGAYTMEQLTILLSMIDEDMEQIRKIILTKDLDMILREDHSLRELNKPLKALHVSSHYQEGFDMLLVGYRKPEPDKLDSRTGIDTKEYVCAFTASNNIIYFDLLEMTSIPIVNYMIVKGLMKELGDRRAANDLILDERETSYDFSPFQMKFIYNKYNMILRVYNQALYSRYTMDNVQRVWEIDFDEDEDEEMIDQQIGAKCDYCNKSTATVACGKCESRKYCCRDCQERDWKYKHSKKCCA